MSWLVLVTFKILIILVKDKAKNTNCFGMWGPASIPGASKNGSITIAFSEITPPIKFAVLGLCSANDTQPFIVQDHEAFVSPLLDIAVNFSVVPKEIQTLKYPVARTGLYCVEIYPTSGDANSLAKFRVKLTIDNPYGKLRGIEYPKLPGLTDTVNTLQLKRQTVKLQMYKRLQGILVFSALSLLFYFSKKENPAWLPFHWKYRWLLLDGWLNTLYLVVFVSIAMLWRPTENNQRYGLDQLATDDYEDEMERGFEGQPPREGIKLRTVTRNPEEFDDGATDHDVENEEDLFRWAEQNIREDESGGTMERDMSDAISRKLKMERLRNGSGSVDDTTTLSTSPPVGGAHGSPRSRSMAPGIDMSRSRSGSSNSLPHMENRSISAAGASNRPINPMPNGSTASDTGLGASQHSLVGDLQQSRSNEPNALISARAKKRASMTTSHFQKIIPSPLVDPNAGVINANQSTGTFELDDEGEGSSSPIPSRPSQVKRKVDMRRLAMYEDVILRLREPGSGLDLKDRSRMFKQYPQTFLGVNIASVATGSEIVEWLIENCNLLTRDEGVRFASNLFEAGYLISVDLLEKFSADSTVNQRTTAKYQLTDTEDRRLLKLKKRFRKQRDEIEALVKEQNIPLDPQANYLPTKDESALEKRSQTEAQYEAKLTDAERLVFWEKKRDIFDASLSLNRRSEIMRPFDPFVDSSVSNPFVNDDTKVWDVVR
ncbi:hypothetical protein HDU67_000994 [Dinochytrium kinnereticum]|nr:hypothetical protein HDU67_000994 [Dinochytrium kinnereticum]